MPERKQLLQFFEGKASLPDCFKFTDKQLAEAKDSEDPIHSLSLSSFDPRLFRGWSIRSMTLDLLIIDEASMLGGLELAKLNKIATTILLIGDPNQLAPIKSNGMSLNYVDQNFHLSKVRRQAENSGVLTLAYSVLKGTRSPSQLLAMAKTLPDIHVVDHFPKKALWQFPALCWRNESRIQIYMAWREAEGLPKNKLVENEPLICTGAKNSEVFTNGSRWFISDPTPFKTTIKVRDEMGDVDVMTNAIISEHPSFKGADKVPKFKAGYGGAYFRHGAAITIHSSQGGQYPASLIYFDDIVAAYHSSKVKDAGGLMLWQRLFYVAVTRAEKKVYLITSMEVK